MLLVQPPKRVCRAGAGSQNTGPSSGRRASRSGQPALGNTPHGGWLLTGSRGGLHAQCSFPWVNGLGLEPRCQRCSKSPDKSLPGHSLGWPAERQQPQSHTQSAGRGLLPEAQERAKNHCPAVRMPGSHPLGNPEAALQGCASHLAGCPDLAHVAAPHCAEEEHYTLQGRECDPWTPGATAHTSQVPPFS